MAPELGENRMRRPRPVKVKLLGPVVLNRTAIRLLTEEFFRWKAEKDRRRSLAQDEGGTTRDTTTGEPATQGDE